MSIHAGISRDSWHKRRATGGKKVPLRKKRKFELGRPPANTKVGQPDNGFLGEISERFLVTRGAGSNWDTRYLCSLDLNESTR